MIHCSFSKAGPKERNQDVVLDVLPTAGGFVFAVADGVGGSANGGLAASRAISAVGKFLSSEVGGDLEAAFRAAQSAIRKDDAGKDTATTLTVCRLVEGRVHFAHVGDSRLYHLRKRGIITRTNDQTEIAELVRRGVFTPQEAKTYPRRNVLLSAISYSSDYDLEVGSFDIMKDDLLVLCTDGMYNVLNKSDIVALNEKYFQPRDFCNAAAEWIEERGPVDDYSWVVVRC